MATHVAIGEFARLTHLSIKTLHHYHQVGLLEPARVDAGSGYRRYSLSQVPQAHMIRRLRALDMPLAEVRSVLRSPDMNMRDALLRDHLARMQNELSRVESMVASLRALLAHAPPLDVEHRQLPARLVVAISALVAIGEIAPWSTRTLDALFVAAADADLTVAGPAGATYSHEFFEGQRGEVVAFVPVPHAAPRGSGLETRELPAETFAVVTHVGPYEDLDRTYGALGSYVIEHRLADPASDRPIYESYLVGPREACEPRDYRTDVCWPIRSDPIRPEQDYP